MWGAVLGFFGFDDRERLVDATDNKGPGLHKSAFIGRKTESVGNVYWLGRTLGQGAFGVVQEAVNKSTGQEVVCKQIRKSGLQDLNFVRNEIEILRTLDHPNIVRIFEYFEDDLSFYIIFERLMGNDLQEELTSRGGGLNVKAVAKYMRQILLATNYCHSLPRPVIHRDLKPGNVMKISRSPDAEIKVIDFGLGALLGDAALKKQVGTVPFMAPEMFDGRYGVEADIWAIGIMLYFLLTGDMPYPRRALQLPFKQFGEVVHGLQIEFRSQRGWENKGLRSARDLLRCLLVQEPTERITASQALKSEFIVRHGAAPGLGWHGMSKKFSSGLEGYAAAPPVLRVVLLMAACQMSHEELGKMKRHFAVIDSDGDGFVSAQEFEALVRHHGGEIFARPGGAASFEEWLQVADIDGDGVIGFTEFVAAWLYSRLSNDSDCLRYAFDVIDEARVGFVTREDVLRSMDTPQFRQLGGSRRLAKDIAEIFPAGARLNRKEFADCLLRSEPVQLGLRFVRAPNACGCQRRQQPRQAQVLTTTRGLDSVSYEDNDSDLETDDADMAAPSDVEDTADGTSDEDEGAIFLCGF